MWLEVRDSPAATGTEYVLSNYPGPGVYYRNGILYVVDNGIVLTMTISERFMQREPPSQGGCSEALLLGVMDRMVRLVEVSKRAPVEALTAERQIVFDEQAAR